MSVFKKYLLVNGTLLFVFHPMLFFAGVMGFGSAPYNTPKMELFKALLALALTGACPNLILLLISALRRKSIIGNLIWSLVFFALVFVAYLVVFWSLLK